MSIATQLVGSIQTGYQRKFLIVIRQGCMVWVRRSGWTPDGVASFSLRKASDFLTVLKPGEVFSSSPGMKQRRTRPLGKYIMTNLLAGLKA